MKHFIVTPEPHNRMPRQQGLLRRGARFYTNIKVPKELQAALGRQHIREALGTSDYREACRKMAFENMRWRAVFEKERQSRPTQEQSQPDRMRVVLNLSEMEAHEIAARYFHRLERQFREWWQRKGQDIDENARTEIIHNLSSEAEVFSTGSKIHAPESGDGLVTTYLREEGIECPPTSPAFAVLRSLFRAARVENAKRSMDLMRGSPAKPRDTLFRDVFAHTPLPQVRRECTIAELLQRFTKAQVDGHRSHGTLKTYEIPARILREVLGADTPLSGITGETIESLCDVLRRAPQNAVQRYPGLTLPQAIEAADKANDERRLKPKTLANYFNNITTLLSFAVEKKLMTENPAKDRWLRQSFAEGDDGPKAQFTLEQLNALFRTPLYTGCKDDGHGWMHPGPNHPRRARFWVPLLALFHGLRCNEACQLYTEDVKERDGIPYLAIREKREDGSKCEKRLKTKQSERDVPLHPLLKRIGFLAFVAKQRKDASSPRLFPELDAGPTGYFSNYFSKWFHRYKAHVAGSACKASFHSFRHQFRDATRAARLPAETVALLAGWEDGNNARTLTMHRYGRGAEFFRVLAEDVAKIKFPGLDLSHLYATGKRRGS